MTRYSRAIPEASRPCCGLGGASPKLGVLATSRSREAGRWLSAFSSCSRRQSRLSLAERGFDDVGGSEVAGLRTIPQLRGDAPLGLRRARTTRLELDVGPDHAQSHRRESAEPRAVVLAHLERSVQSA